MNVSLTPALEKFVTKKVSTGRYTSASEVVRESLRLLEEHDSSRAAQIAAFNKELGQRMASLDRGERSDPAAARQRIGAKSQARKKLRA
jgi:antitoxin ParD1/3/4